MSRRPVFISPTCQEGCFIKRDCNGVVAWMQGTQGQVRVNLAKYFRIVDGMRPALVECGGFPPSTRNTMPATLGLQWIEIDENAGVLALKFGKPGAVLLAVKRNTTTNSTQAFWMDEQGNVLGRIKTGQA